jgi:hypothetical protein
MTRPLRRAIRPRHSCVSSRSSSIATTGSRCVSRLFFCSGRPRCVAPPWSQPRFAGQGTCRACRRCLAADTIWTHQLSIAGIRASFHFQVYPAKRELAGTLGNGKASSHGGNRVRIPVAVLQNPRVVGGFVVLGAVRHSRRRLCRREERSKTLSCRVLAAWHEVPVAVPGLADIAVAGRLRWRFAPSLSSPRASDSRSSSTRSCPRRTIDGLTAARARFPVTAPLVSVWLDKTHRVSLD